MALPFIDVMLEGRKGRVYSELLVDSGVVYSLLPFKAWRAAGLKAHRTTTVTLLDGTRIERKVANCRCQFGGTWRDVPVLLGKPGDHGIMGWVMLCAFEVSYNPAERCLRRIARPREKQPRPRYAGDNHGPHVR
jgi:predicted aspartyl protease